VTTAPATSHTTTRPRGSVRPSRRRLHLLLGVQSAIIVLLSVNRLSDATTGFVAGNEFLRWVDLDNLVLAGATLITAYLLIKHLEYDSARRDGTAHRVLGVAFLVGVCLYAASYGDHEVTNYLNVRFCDGTPDAGTRLCEIIAYHDDGFSHYLFFAGFTVINVAIMLTQVVFPDEFPDRGGRSRTGDTALIALNALVVAAGIMANLGFEKIGLDLYVVAAVAVLAVVLLVRQPSQPILRYYAIAYVVGLAGAGAGQLA
jgi:phosphatidylserine synthase